MIHNTDITIIGAGPVGLFAVFEAGMMKMKCHVIDSLDFIGGQCTALYPEKPIYDIPAHPSILAEDLIKNLEKQASPFKPEYHLSQTVNEVTKNNDGWLVTTSKGTQIQCKVIIIAAGCGAFGPNRPPLADIEEYEGKSVFYMVGKKEEMRDKNVVIAGGGDSAVDWVLSLVDIAKSVSVVHRRPKFRCLPDSQDKLEKLADEGRVNMVVPYQLDSLKGNNGKLESVIVKTLKGEEKELKADILLPFFGLAMELGPIANWGLNIDKKHISVNPTTLQTNQDGIFAIGDIATYDNKMKLILNGFAEAAMACHKARGIVYPDEVVHFEYSTTAGVPA
ncbi:MAG: ferredoxin--NADP(+) reductase [Alphaproteobacteria bacterium CG11_big_fil_rev_8_21_14_0_20_39_49]|nr:MAG: ferredoxin--NADP(+) reductase [Alphaproteobacteria bacterium CG11_big_fil_rev_8_21_14_0_20_39_49]